jgi:two-component system, LytTR family, sensor kinase
MDITGAVVMRDMSKNKTVEWLLSLWQRSFTEWKPRVLLHTVFWLFLLFFWLRESLIVHIDFSQKISSSITGVVLALVVFYPLVYLIIPLLQKKKWVRAIAVFIVYYIVAILLRTYHISLLVANSNGSGIWFAGQDFWTQFYEYQLRPYRLFAGFFSSIEGLISIIYIPLAIKFLRFAYRAYQRRLLLEKENLQLELNFLKAQVNPHLLFNSLNNLQSFILHEDKEKAIELLNRLAGLLRFSIYECKGEFVSLQQEFELLHNYVSVERVRYDEDTGITLSFSGEAAGRQLPALLLMPLVENAFKYSSGVSIPEIRISLAADIERIVFFIRNKYERNVNDGEDGGIGIENVKKRLQLYFPGKHELTIKDEYPYFEVSLNIYHL